MRSGKNRPKRGARRIQTDIQVHMHDGTPEARTRPDRDDLFMQTMARVIAPADISGTISLAWRYRDGAMPDAFWTFVPGLRRTRLTDPLNRSDGFLGSDISLDDGNFFDAKPEDFTFTVLGQQEQLVLIDPFALVTERRAAWGTRSGGDRDGSPFLWVLSSTGSSPTREACTSRGLTVPSK